jgi:hypothetical protein
MNDNRTWTWCYDPLNPIFCPKAKKERKTNYPSANCWKKKTKKQTLCIAAPMSKGTNKQTHKRI